MDSSTSVSSMPETTATSPMRTGKHEMDFAPHGLLIVHQTREQVGGGDAIERRNGAVEPQHLEDLDAVFGGKVARQLAQEDGGAHAEGDGLAMQEAGVAGFGFEGVAEGVAEIEDAAEVAFALVGGDHFALHADGIGDDAVHGVRLARQHVAAAIGEKAEQIGFADDAGLDDFVEAGAVFAFGKRRREPRDRSAPRAAGGSCR